MKISQDSPETFAEMGESNGYNTLQLPGVFDRIVCFYSHIGDFTELLTSAEAGAVSAAVSKRKREYSTGRWLARRALSCLGQEVEHLLSGVAREPLWPEGICGSITHTDSLAAVAVANCVDILGIGIDMERVGAVDQKLLPKLLTRVERANLNGIDPTLIFSAKEACYKLLYPIVGEYVDFKAVEVSVNETDRLFSLRYIGSSPANAIVEQATGIYMDLENHWISCVMLPRI
jgi:4'-phosphopantetheinyl transferase EntD